MYAIVGATGNTGRAAALNLLDRGEKVRVIARDAARGEELRARGAEVAIADVEDAASLASAFAGAKGAYLMIPPPYAAPDFHGLTARIAGNLASAAAGAGLPHVVALSSVGAHLKSGNGAIGSLTRLERALADAGLDRTILRPAYFLQNWGSVAALAKEQGILPSMLQPLDRRVAMVDVADIGLAAAEALLSPAKGERIVNLAGPADYSPADAAAAFASALGREVQAVPPPREAWQGILTGAGLGETYAAALVEMYDAINAGVVGFPAGEPVRRGATTVAASVGRLV